MTTDLPISAELAALQTLTAIVPDEADQELAREYRRTVASVADARGDSRISVTDATGLEHTAKIPASILRLVSSALAEMARGNAVSLIPVTAEVTTQEAADILNVSRPYLVGLLEKGAMPFRKVGIQRRIQISDLMDYKSRSEAERRIALDALARQSQELRLGYEE